MKQAVPDSQSTVRWGFISERPVAHFLEPEKKSAVWICFQTALDAAAMLFKVFGVRVQHKVSPLLHHRTPLV